MREAGLPYTQAIRVLCVPFYLFPLRYLPTRWIPLIKVHLLRVLLSSCFLAASPSALAPGIVNCLIDKITTASYMHRISLTLPRFPPTALTPTLPHPPPPFHRLREARFGNPPSRTDIAIVRPLSIVD